ncbi:MAG: methyl-accepting chemotaxis protein, partial [Gammaproteobacteria bacterium]|nr:methyl-accepting chemotaxis protein [Gammaproteobacteria bacterium]
EVQIVSKQQSEIIDLVETLSPRFEAVHQAMHFQSQGAEQINEAMIKLNEDAQQTVESLRLANRATYRLNDSAQSLQASVSRFKVGK